MVGGRAGACPEPGATAASASGPARLGPERRDVCIWLGVLASWRAGLVKRLLARFGSVDAVLRQPPTVLAGFCASGARRRSPGTANANGSAAEASESSIEERRFNAYLCMEPERCAREMAAGAGRLVVAWCDPLYPPALRHLADPPLCLFVRGSSGAAETERRVRALSRSPCVALVGTRAPSSYGEEMAAVLARDLAARHAIVISGMAMGIDAIAQRGALAASPREPATVGVLGCGPDIVYPRVNARLFADVGARGLLVSEFAWGVPARAWRFPARNRVMAALSRGVVVIEGAARSGALLTAGFALDLGRDVFAVPGEAGRRLSAGPHALLRQGASLCESAADVLEPGFAAGPPAAAGFPGEAGLSWSNSLEGAPAAVLEALERGSATPDQAARVSGLPVHVATAVLSGLEVDGLVRRAEGGAYRLRTG